MQVTYVVSRITFTDKDFYWVDVYPEGEPGMIISIPIPRTIFDTRLVTHKVDTMRTFITEALKRITNPRDYITDDILTHLIGEKITIPVTGGKNE